MKIYALTYTRAAAEKAAETYEEEGYDVTLIHGGQGPAWRARYVQTFRKHRHDQAVLVATIDAVQMPIDVGLVDIITVLEKHPDEVAQRQAMDRARTHASATGEPN